MSTPATRYRAFICYSQRDSKAATKLHQRLETYRVPRRLVGTEGRHGPVPANLAPVFRDRDELAASADIGERLRDALARADFLIVLCSPAAARSQWVNAEIETFCALHADNQERVLAVILDGEPASPDPAAECFPSALRPARTDGDLGLRYPLAADLRPGKERRRDAGLRLIAALLGVTFDELKRREQERRIRRLRVMLAATCALVLAIAGLAIFAYQQRVQAHAAAARARGARVEAEKLVDFLLNDLRPKMDEIGKLDLLESANAKVRAYYETVARDEDDANMLRRRAAAFQQYAVDLRSHKKGAKTLQILLAAAAMRERLVQLSPSDPSAWQTLAETRRYLCLQRRDDGDLPGALKEIRLAMAGQQRAVKLIPDDFAAETRLATLPTEEADVLMRSGQTVVAAERLERALKALEGLSQRKPENFEIKNREAAVTWQLGNAYRRMGDYVRAEKACLRSVTLAKELQKADPANILFLRRLAQTQGGFGQLLMEAGRHAEAMPVLQAAMATDREIVAVDPANLVYQDALATGLANLTANLISLERPVDALPLAREVVTLREHALAEGANDLRAKNTLAMGLATLGSIQNSLGQTEDAVASDQRAIAIQQEISRSAPADRRMRDDLGYFHAKLGWVLLATKRLDGAIIEFRAAIAIMDEVLEKDAGNPQLARRGERAEWLLGLGSALRANGANGEAARVLRECVAAIDQVGKEGLPPQVQAENREKAEKLLVEITGR